MKDDLLDKIADDMRNHDEFNFKILKCTLIIGVVRNYLASFENKITKNNGTSIPYVLDDNANVRREPEGKSMNHKQNIFAAERTYRKKRTQMVNRQRHLYYSQKEEVNKKKYGKEKQAHYSDLFKVPNFPAPLVSAQQHYIAFNAFALVFS